MKNLKLFKTLLVLIGVLITSLTTQTWAVTSTTVYYAISSSDVGSCKVKINVNYKGDGDEWPGPMEMTKQTGTYNGKDVYKITFNDKYDGLGCIQFQVYDGDDQKDNVQAFGTKEWTVPSVYNGQLWEKGSSGWKALGYDYNVSVSAETGGSVDPTGTVRMNSAFTTSLSATPDNGYYFTGWTISGGGITPSSSTTNPQTFTASSTGGTIQANFDKKWSIKGGDSEKSDSEDALGNWGTDNFLTYADGFMVGYITLPADQDFYFKVVDREGSTIWYGYNGTITNTTASWLLFSKNETKNCKIHTGEAGTYVFKWNADTKYLGVYYPQARLVKNTYIYFDSRNETYWNSYKFDARFWFKYYDSNTDISSVDCAVTDTLDNWVYYAVVPNNDYVGKIQLNRLNPDDHSAEGWGIAEIAYAFNRSSTKENCLKEESGKEGWKDSWTPQWTTYCPPMSSVTLADNSTTTWGGNGSSSTPYLVPTSGDIKVHVTASASALDDPNMTKYFLFKKAGSAVGSGSTTTSKTITASSTTGTKEAVIVEAYNYYNSTEGTHLASSAIYYEARTPYTVSYAKGSPSESISGSRDSETKLKGVNFTLPSSAVFTRNHYTQTGWTTSDGGTQTHALGGSYTTDAAQAFYPVWTEDDYTVTASAADGGSVGSTSYTAHVATTCAIMATPATGYKFSHWSVESGTVTFGDQYSASTTITATADSEIQAHFVYRWSMAGSWLNYPKTENWDADTYTMGNIGTNASSKDTCYVEITLAANTNYTFKVVDRSTDPYSYYGNNTSTYYMTYGNSSAWSFPSTDKAACGITTAGAGTYKFAYNITDKTLTVTYPTSYLVTAAMNPASGGGSVTPSSATYMSTSDGGTITATPNYSHYFNGWTSSAGGTFTDASAASTTFKPGSAAATVTAALPERTAFIEGNFAVYDASRNTLTKTGDSWQDASTAIKMTYDSENNRYYLHTYRTPEELAEQVNSNDAYFYIKTSTSTSSIADDVIYRAYSSGVQSLATYGSSNKKATGTSEHSFKFTGSEDGYVIIYFNGTHVWYELECALSYYKGHEDATGDNPASRTFYAYGSNQTAASNTYSRTGYSFNGWKTNADEDYAAGATNVAMNAHEVCLNAQWAADEYTVTLNNNSATTAGASSVAVTYDAAVGNIASNLPAKTGYVFDGYYDNEECTGSWIISKTGYFVWGNSYVDASGNWIGTSDVTLYAKWVVRYALYGSVEGSDVAGYGMPGWAEATDFTYDAENSKYTLDLSLTKPNTTYKFRIVDHTDNESWGLASKAVVPEKTATKLNSTAADAQLATAGTGTYSLTVTEVDAPTTHPQVYIVNPASYQVNYGKSLSAGGTITVVDDASNAIPSGGYVRKGGSVTYTAAANTGYTFVGWFTSDAYSGEPFSTDASWKDSDIKATSNSYAKFVPATLTFKKDAESSDWFDASNWSPACVPTINHDVVIKRRCWLDRYSNAKAKSVEIHNYGDGETEGYLYIYSGLSYTGGLVVAEGITAVHSDGGDPEATTKDDLWIDTDERGNGGLICGSASANTKAKYYFYTKARKYNYSSSSYYINQYVGIPFASMPADQIYGFNIFVYDADADDWRTPTGEGANTMQPWTAYNLIRQYSNTDWNIFTLNGTLNLPGIEGAGRLKTLTCSSEMNRVSTGKGTSDVENEFFDSNGDYMFANSWTAPISIKDLQTSDISDLNGDDKPDIVPIIYIFNAGFDGASSKGVGTYAGTWTPFPFNSSSYMENAVIPATQAFLVSAKVPNATLTLDYKKHVYDPALADGINTFPTRAPRRNTKMTNEPTKLKIVANCDSTEADNLYIFERGDFSEGYDEGWDGGKLVDYAYSFAPQLYAIHGVNKLGVDAVKEMDGTNLGFKAGSQSNEYTLTFDYNDEEPLYLYDKETNALTQITNEATYEFTTSDTEEHARFLLTRSNAPQIATGVEEIDSENVQRAQKFMQDQQILIRRGDRVYNVTGSLVK